MLQWNYYQPTELENRITVLYHSIGIETVDDLQEDLIAARLGIKLRYEDAPSFSFEKGDFRCIVIDKNLSSDEKRKHFFHELGHLFRGHSGDQANFPDLFKDLLEEQAEQFAKYAMMPHYMIQSLPIPEYERYYVYLIASEFNVSLTLAKERWEQIKRRISVGRWEQVCIDQERNRYKKANPDNWCDDAKEIFRIAIDRKMQKGQGVIIR